MSSTEKEIWVVLLMSLSLSGLLVDNLDVAVPVDSERLGTRVCVGTLFHEPVTVSL